MHGAVLVNCSHSVATGGKPVEILEMRICVQGRDDIVIPLATEQAVAAVCGSHFEFKEGEEYLTKVCLLLNMEIIVTGCVFEQIRFRVNGGILLGLQFRNDIYRHGLRSKLCSMKQRLQL